MTDDRTVHLQGQFLSSRCPEDLIMADDFRMRVTFVILVCAAVAGAATLAWMTRVILLLLFAGVIGALLLSTMTDWIQAKLKTRRGLSLAVVVTFLVTCIGLGVWMRGPALAQQFSDLQIDLPTAAHKIVVRLQEQGWGRWLLSRYEDPGQLSEGLRVADAKNRRSRYHHRRHGCGPLCDCGGRPVRGREPLRRICAGSIELLPRRTGTSWSCAWQAQLRCFTRGLSRRGSP